MAKLTGEEFNNKYAEKISDNDDLLIELMEDFADSTAGVDSSELDTLREEIATKDAEIESLKTKYKERFLNAIVEDKKDDDLIEEKEVIDVKEI